MDTKFKVGDTVFLTVKGKAFFNYDDLDYNLNDPKKIKGTRNQYFIIENVCKRALNEMYFMLPSEIEHYKEPKQRPIEWV